VISTRSDVYFSKTYWSWVWWHMSVVPATWEAQIEGSWFVASRTKLARELN
jgi:hypothetical protein